MTKAVLLALALSSLVACKGGSESKGGGKVASCNSAAMGACVEYNDSNLALGSDSIAKLCTVVDKAAVFTMTACPKEGVTGSCASNEHKDYYYASYPISIADSEKSCTDKGGTFVRGK
jgi:hypothetical protein